jgi:hypothetical protein
MKDAEFQWLASSDPRLAAYAASRLPAWLWTADGTRILWANAAGARLFAAANAAALAEKTFGPSDRHRRQVARLAGRLLAGGAIRLERLQGFGAALGGLATCGCLRFDFPDGSHGVLIAAGNSALTTPRLAQAQPDDEMQPAAASAEQPPSKPISSEPILSEPVLQPSAPVVEQTVAPQSHDYPQPMSRPPKPLRPRPRPWRVRHPLPSKRLPASRCRTRAACRCASPGGWIARAASRSAPTNFST